MKIYASEIRVGMLIEYKSDLWQVLKTQHVKPGKGGAFAQVEMKSLNKNKLLVGKKIKNICKKHKVKFLINDDPKLAKKLNADGCHLGQKDMNIHKARKIMGNKVIGISCHNSMKLAKSAINSKADYLAFGAFYPSKTKLVKYKADLKILKWAKKNTSTPIVAIGGIKLSNYKKLLLNKANFLAISGYIWSNKNTNH